MYRYEVPCDTSTTVVHIPIYLCTYVHPSTYRYLCTMYMYLVLVRGTYYLVLPMYYVHMYMYVRPRAYVCLCTCIDTLQ